MPVCCGRIGKHCPRQWSSCAHSFRELTTQLPGRLRNCSPPGRVAAPAHCGLRPNKSAAPADTQWACVGPPPHFRSLRSAAGTPRATARACTCPPRCGWRSSARPCSGSPRRSPRPTTSSACSSWPPRRRGSRSGPRRCRSAASRTTGRRFRTLINVGELAPIEERFPTDETYDIAEFPRAQELIDTGKPYFNSLDDPDCDPASAALLTAHGKTSDLGIAIEVEGRRWGAIWATTISASASFDSADLRFLESIAGQLGNAIARAELFSQVSRLAYEDPLTGLANRRALEERLERSFERFARDGTSLALLLCDVDGLKAINDSRGHGAGDAVLISVAEALVAAAADYPGAFVARLAGDEFCVLLQSPSAPHGGRASIEIEAVAATAQRALAGGEAGRGVTLSCGAATAGPRVDIPSLLLAEADTAQYMAKRRGGNRICTAAEAAEGSGPVPAPLEVASPSARIEAAAAELMRAFDGELRDAGALDRLEAVAIAFTEAGDLSRWAISIADHGRPYLRDLSLGDNRLRTAPASASPPVPTTTRSTTSTTTPRPRRSSPPGRARSSPAWTIRRSTRPSDASSTRRASRAWSPPHPATPTASTWSSSPATTRAPPTRSSSCRCGSPRGRRSRRPGTTACRRSATPTPVPSSSRSPWPTASPGRRPSTRSARRRWRRSRAPSAPPSSTSAGSPRVASRSAPSAGRSARRRAGRSRSRPG